MIIAFSGLGGSGKTLQAKKLKEEFEKEGKKAKLIHLSEKFRLINLVKKNTKTKSTWNVDLNPGIIKSIKSLLMSVYYVLHSWGFYFSTKRKTVILDRYYDDFLVGLYYRKRIPKSLLKVMLRLIPRPDLHYYVKVTHLTAYERKKEHPKKVIKAEETAYDEYLKLNNKVIIINGEKREKEVFNQIVFFTDKPKNLLPEEFAVQRSLFEKKCPHFSVDIADKMIEYANANKCLYQLYLLFKKNKIGCSKESKLDEYFSEKLKKIKRTIEYVKKNYKEAIIIKSLEKDADLGEDIDLLIPTGEIKKEEIQIPGGLPLDIHYSINYDGIVFLKGMEKKIPFDELNYLVTVAHAVFEAGTITLNDVLKSKNKKVSKRIKKMVDEDGWINALEYFEEKTKKRYQRYPIFIPLPLVISFKTKKIINNLTKKQGIGKNIIFSQIKSLANIWYAHVRRRITYYEKRL